MERKKSQGQAQGRGLEKKLRVKLRVADLKKSQGQAQGRGLEKISGSGSGSYTTKKGSGSGSGPTQGDTFWNRVSVSGPPKSFATLKAQGQGRHFEHRVRFGTIEDSFSLSAHRV